MYTLRKSCIKGTQFLKYIIKNMVDQNKRINTGTEHSLKSLGKIGGDFKKGPNAEFLKLRTEVFEKLFAQQQEFFKTLPRENIVITLKDGKKVDGTSFQTTPLEIAKKCLKRSLIDDLLAAKVRYTKKIFDLSAGLTSAEDEETNPEDEKFTMWDLERPLEGDCEIEYVTFDDKDGKVVFWHSSAHILGSALENLYGAYLCIGPPLENGFYYDAYVGENHFSETMYAEIEKSVKEVTTKNYDYQRLTLTKQQALELFQSNPFKVQLITNKVPENGKTSAYRCGNLIDLCMGPHLPRTGMVKAFKVTKNSSCYWLANNKNDTLQRIYGVSFKSKKELDEYVKLQEDIEKRDHRNVGRHQDLFMHHDLSPGSTFFYKHGASIYNKLVDFIRREYVVRNFNEVITPNIFNIKLWKTSGHYKNYKDNLFLLKVENQCFGLKPMNCPGHCLMFDSKVRSYKELPIRMADFGVLHRNEISGALSGLTRVRRFQQDDAHIFCAPSQITQEIMNSLDFLDYIYSVFGFHYELFLSTRPEKALGDIKLWDQAEKALEEALNKFGKPWKLNPGDGAFYGPKIDIKLYDALKRQHQCGTIQLDFQLPIRFNLQFKTEENVTQQTVDKEKELHKNEEHNKDVYGKDEWDDEVFTWQEHPVKPGYARPVIIHRAILGSVERLIAILIEHTAGKWPFWLSPRQAVVCTVSEKFNAYAEKVHKRLVLEGFNAELDISNQTLNKKVRNGQLEQFNYICVVGEEEEKQGSVDVRSREDKRLGKFTISALIDKFRSETPAQSKCHMDLVSKSFNTQTSNTCCSDGNGMEQASDNGLNVLEEKLKFDLFIGGESPNEEDKKHLENFKDTVISKEKYPNVYKWRLLLNKHFNK